MPVAMPLMMMVVVTMVRVGMGVLAHDASEPIGVQMRALAVPGRLRRMRMGQRRQLTGDVADDQQRGKNAAEHLDPASNLSLPV